MKWPVKAKAMQADAKPMAPVKTPQSLQLTAAIPAADTSPTLGTNSTLEYKWLAQQALGLPASLTPTAFADQYTDWHDPPMVSFQKYVLLRTIDEKWREHLAAMDQLREGIGLRAYAQKNPLIEYKQEGFKMFEQMMFDTNKETISRISKMNLSIMAQRLE